VVADALSQLAKTEAIEETPARYTRQLTAYVPYA